VTDDLMEPAAGLSTSDKLYNTIKIRDIRYVGFSCSQKLIISHLSLPHV